MTTDHLVSTIRRHWLLVLASAILGGFVASVYTFAATPQYASSTKIFIAAQPSITPEAAYTGAQFAASRMASYVDLATGQALAARTVERLHLQTSPADLAQKVSATVKPGSVIVELSVTDSSAVAARDLANALSDDFVQMVQDLETSAAGGNVAAHAQVIWRAGDARWISPDRRLILPLGVVIGVVIGIALALIRDALREGASRQTVDEPRLASGRV